MVMSSVRSVPLSLQQHLAVIFSRHVGRGQYSPILQSHLHCSMGLCIFSLPILLLQQSFLYDYKSQVCQLMLGMY